MKTKLVELRLRIDLINQLVESLFQPIKLPQINVSHLTDEQVKEWVKEFGQTSDLLSVKSPIESVNYRTSELELCFNSLRLSKARLGKILGLLGELSPYQNDGKRQTVEDIEPASDKAVLEFEGLSHAFKTKQTFIEKIDWLREKIGEIRKDCLESITELLDLRINPDEANTSAMDLFLQCQTSIVELDNARFYLGFELGRIREENK